MAIDLKARADAAKQTRERYFGATLDHAADSDCGKMVIHHLRTLGHGGPIASAGGWRSATGLAKFLKRHGGSGAACLDGWGIERIPPARAIVGDVVEMPGQPPFGAFGVCMGNGAVLAWSEHPVAGNRCAILRPPMLAAWRP